MRKRTINDVHEGPSVIDAGEVGGSGKTSAGRDWIESKQPKTISERRQVASALERKEPSRPKPRTQFATGPPPPRLALSIPEFCSAHGISEGLFFKLKKQGKGPRVMKVGTRTLISFESAAEWRLARENEQGRAPRELP